MEQRPTRDELADLRERAAVIYERCESADEAAVELGLSLADTLSLLGLADGSPASSGWRIDIPPIGPPGIRRE